MTAGQAKGERFIAAMLEGRGLGSASSAQGAMDADGAEQFPSTAHDGPAARLTLLRSAGSMQRTARAETAALRPVEPEPGMLVHTRADRQLAAEHWLLSTHPAPSNARAEWDKHGVALLPLGTLFSAVRIPGRLLLALVGSEELRAVDVFLGQVLDGGPVICDPHGHRYYALVPASMPATWHQAAEEWRAALDVDVLGRGTYLGVPRMDALEVSPQGCVSYWAVPMASAATLCAPLAVARLIAAGQHRISEGLQR
ncbi:hypothetical protein ACFWIZ_04805 [Streptomyces sp. NPDC127044]